MVRAVIESRMVVRIDHIPFGKGLKIFYSERNDVSPNGRHDTAGPGYVSPVMRAVPRMTSPDRSVSGWLWSPA